MPRFVLLTHNHPFLHWDFMLEIGGALRTWRLLDPPDTPGTVNAQPLPDHRLHYLDYEGPVSGDRGEVRQWDRGEYELTRESPTCLEVRLHGGKLEGTALLEAHGPEQRWTFYFVSS